MAKKKSQPAGGSSVRGTWSVLATHRSQSKAPCRSGPILPLRYATRRPGRPCRFHLFLQFCEIDFNQLAQLCERCLKLLRRHRVLVDLSLRRTRGGHALCADNPTDSFVDRRGRVDIALSRRGVTAECPQDFASAPIKC